MLTKNIGYFYVLILIITINSVHAQECLGKDYAIFFPVNEYVKSADLKHPTQEAKAIAGVLEKKYGFETEIIQEVTSISIRGELEKYREKVINDNDRLLIFFSGHGSKEGFHPKDYYESYKTESTLSRDTLQAIIRRLPFAHTLVVVDACFGGVFLEDTRSNDTRQDTLNQLCKHFRKQSHLLMSPSKATEITSDNSLLAKRFVALLNDYADDNKILSAYDIFRDVSNRKKNTTPRFGSFISRNQVGSSFLFIPKSQKRQLKSKCSAFRIDCKLEKERCVFCPEDEYGRQYPMTKVEQDNWTIRHLLKKDNTALFTWGEAKNACRELENNNWRLPTEREWKNLLKNKVGGYMVLNRGKFSNASRSDMKDKYSSFVRDKGIPCISNKDTIFIEGEELVLKGQNNYLSKIKGPITVIGKEIISCIKDSISIRNMSVKINNKDSITISNEGSIIAKFHKVASIYGKDLVVRTGEQSFFRQDNNFRIEFTGYRRNDNSKIIGESKVVHFWADKNEDGETVSVRFDKKYPFLEYGQDSDKRFACFCVKD